MFSRALLVGLALFFVACSAPGPMDAGVTGPDAGDFVDAGDAGEALDAGCLVLAPDVLDLGDVVQGCPLARDVTLFTTCTDVLPLEPLAFSSGGVTASWASDAGVLRPGEGAVVQVRFDAQPLGVTSVVVPLLLGAELTVRARVVAPVPFEDVFQQLDVQRPEVVFIVDSSPSFVPRRAQVQRELDLVMTQLQFARRCSQPRVSFITTDLDGGAPVQVFTDAGLGVIDAANDGGAGLRALLDALPVGSEVESCIGPAAAWVATHGADAGPDGRSFICFTDAPEQAAQPLSLADDVLASGPVRWHVTAPFAPDTCGVEALDDGTHAAIATRLLGTRSSVCDAQWLPTVGSLGDTCERTMFWLASTPRPGLSLSVTVDGQPVAASAWRYDAAENAVVFTSPPRDGALVRVTGTPVCL